MGAVETSFTIQAWVKPTDCENPSGAPTILSKVYSFKIGCDDGTWQYVLGNGTAWYTGTGWVDTDVPADNNVWQHVALTRASSSTGVKFFLNGVQSYSVSSYEGDLGNNNNQSLYVGSRSGQYATSDAWHGLIDDVRIYTSDRTSNISDDMNEYPNVDDQYLNAFFDFNLERDDDTITGISNMATGSGASSSSLTSVTGSPKVVRTWDVSTSGSDTILTFERTVLTAQGGWRVPAGVSSAETMVVGGGGGGGYNTGGGGGGGGVEYSSSTTLTSGSTMTVVVGQGGQGSTASSSNGANGKPSQLGTTVVGGGGGGASWTSSGADGADAPTGSPAFTQNGSGGGASNANGAGGTGAKDGGDGATNAGGGGGGAGQDGSDASSSTSGGGGGFGIARANLTGSLNQYGSGGGGGSWNNEGSKASGGSGAGDGGNANSAASHGTHHRGGGGGGGGSGSNTKDGGNGGSGIVIVRYASVDHNDWSVATWFNASSLQGSTIIGTYDDNGQASDIGWALRIRAANGNLYSTVGPSSNTSAAWTSDASIDTDRWYHVVMVADVGNTLRLYLDGVNVANGSLSGSGDLRDVSNNVFLGSYNGGEEDQPFDGQIGSVMVFADALNASNINQLYTSGKGVYSNTTNLSYAQSSSTLLLGQTYSFPITVANGEVTTSYSLTGTLPSGMNFESSNGTIWGTPTGAMTSTTYTVTANNSAGSYSTSISLTSQHVAPYDLVYSPENMTLEKGTAMTTNTPSVSGGTITSWAISPSLPSGLAFSTSTGAISGTPTVLQTIATTYTIWANNSGGSASAQVNMGDDAISMAFGHQHACVLLDSGEVKCWGRNNAGQLGHGGGDKDTPQPAVDLGSGRTATSIYAGGYYSCAILDDESVKCWGQNTDGQLGIGTNVNTNTPTTIGTLGSGRTAISLATAFSAICALLDDGSVKCWGDDSQGQLGNGGSNSDLNSPPASAINLGAGRTAKAITGGKYHFCAILDDDSIKCWGDGSNGKLGTGSISDKNTPTSTSGSFASGRYAVVIDAGYEHTCVILDNGDLTCWGGDAWGQLGNGATTGTKSSLQSTAVDLGTGRTAISLSAGGTHTCAQLDNYQLMCWGNRADGQVGDDGGFNNPSDRISPSAVSDNTNGGNTYLDTGIMPSTDVIGATCAISPSLPTGLSLNQGTCDISGTPTVTAVNATYTVWANISGTSYSGQVWLEVGLNVPIPSYSPATYTYTKDSAISTVLVSNTGGEVTTWAINASLPSGLTFGTTNGSIWGTPDTITASTTYTVWANNSAGSGSTTITLTVNDVAPSITFTPSSLNLVVGTAMTSLTASNSGGTIVSCSDSPSLPSGLSLSSTCTLSGTPTVTSTTASYTITATNTGGSDTATISITVQPSGGSLSITPTNREGSVNSALASISMSYTHTASNYGWTSGVSNSTSTITNNYLSGGGQHLLGIDSGEQGEMVIVYPHNDTGLSTHSLGMMYRWDGTWTETILDTATDTGHHPSVAIDRQGAIHIAYVDYSTNPDSLRYATNASGTWVFTTLGYSGSDGQGGRGTAIVVHPITDAVHIVATTYESSSRGLRHFTNEGGSWVNETITDSTKDEGHDPAMEMDGDGNLYVVYYCDSGCSDLRLSSRINGVWQNETVASTNNIGKVPDIAIDSQGTIHIVSQYHNDLKIHLHSGTPGSWTAQTTLSGNKAYWPVVEVDSNDAVHIAYHYATTEKDVKYMTNASGSWTWPPSILNGYGGWGSEMVIDANDDIFIPNVAPGLSKIQLTKVMGSGQGLTARPIYDISPMLPDGLTMNWRTGTISGTPTEALANTTFTVTVTALGTTTTSTFTLFITGEPGVFAYEDIEANNQTFIITATPSFSNISTSGTVTSWAISPDVPSGLSFGTSNGSIWGAPTVEQIKISYTVWANNTAGSSSTTVNITIGPEAPGPFEYNPENNIWTNNTEVHLAPNFVNITTGNGTTWTVTSTIFTPYPSSNDGICFAEEVDGVLYLAGSVSGSSGLFGYGLQNHTTWRVSTITAPGCYSYVTGWWSTTDLALSHHVGDTLYFSGSLSNGTELYAYNTANDTTWLVADINQGTGSSNPGAYFFQDAGEVLLFSADDGSSGHELWGHNTSNGTTWRVADINSGSGSSLSSLNANNDVRAILGDVVLFKASDGSGRELWAYNLSNTTVWQAANLSSGVASPWGINAESYQLITVGDVAYFGAIVPNSAVSEDRELYAYNVTNQTTWAVTDLSTNTTTGAKVRSLFWLNDVLYFKARVGLDDVYSCVAHAPANATTWVKNDGLQCPADFEGRYKAWVGSILYSVLVNEIQAYNPDNESTWSVFDAIVSGGAGTYAFHAVGDVLYFSGSKDGAGNSRRSLWAHDTTNGTTWFVEGSNTTTSSYATPQFIHASGNTSLYQHFVMSTTSLMAVQAAEINSLVNTGGPVTSYAINATLPDGLSFGANNGTIYGTPAELWTQTSYMVWANNSGGSSVAYLNITVVDELPSISYTPAVLDLTNNTVSADLPLAPTITGAGEITSWEINATLPDGLSFGATNGTIWGTPTELSSTTAYMVWANNSGGSSVAYLNITVVDELPTISYTLAALDLANNTVSADLPLAPTITGAGEITSWEINATLPDGLSFGATNGTIWGTPTELWTQTSYMVWANNSGGSSVAYLNITVVDEVPTLSYTPNSLVLTKGQQSNDFPLTAALSGSGVITSWEINATLPAGLNFGTSNGTIWGIPTVLQTTASTYTIWANNTGGSTSATVTITINDQVSGPFEYIPEDNTWTNNSYVNIGPSFINTTTGNGSTWEVANINSGSASSNAGQYMITSIGDVIYFSANAANAGHELWAYNASNSTTWLVKEIRPGSSGSNPGGNMVHAINGVLYFNAMDGSSGQELWKHDPSTGTTSRVYDIRPGSSGSSIGSKMSMVVDDVLFFSANDGNSGHELWAYNTSNGSNPWRVMDINSGSDSSNPGDNMAVVVGDTLYFDADDGSAGLELWAHDTSNQSTWQVTDISSGSGNGNPGRYMQILVGDTIYFSATDDSTGDELWAHDTSNHSTWQVADINHWIMMGGAGLSSNPGEYMAVSVGDTIYFSAAVEQQGAELWAHDISNQSTWRVVEIYTGSIGSNPGENMAVVVGDTLYFDANDGISGEELWAHDTSNHSTWRVTDIINGVSGSSPAAKMSILVGDTIYFDADDYFDGHELWAHDVSNQSTWQVADISGGSRSSNPGHISEILVGDTLYFSADDGNTGFELWAHRPSLINHQTNTGGSVTSYAINATLPEGLSFGTNNGTIWGTPTELWTQTSYMVWANNSGGSSLAYLNITVVDELPTVAYTPAVLDLTNNTVSADLPLAPTIIGAGEITSWEINATLPDGLSFGAANGTIWGTPTELLSTTAYMVWANNSGGSSVAYLNITVVDELPTVAYTPATLDLTNNTVSADLPLAPTITGAGEITSWEINATLPDGLSLGSTNGTIWGTPTELLSTTAYMVWANNSGGSSVAYLNITVVDELPTVAYTPAALDLTNNTVSADLPLAPTITGAGEITSWEINATLPDGLSFGATNGTIWGTPTELWTTTAYMVWANNSGGSSVAYLNITVVDELPTISYSPSDFQLMNNTASSDLPLVPVITGSGEITSWEINATLPDGLSFGATNGTIWGTPTELWTTTGYMVWANNSGGSSVAYLNITVVDELPALSYNPNNLELTNNTQSSDFPLNPTIIGSGEITSWEINATLPAGLSSERPTERFGVFQRFCRRRQLPTLFGPTTAVAPLRQPSTSRSTTRLLVRSNTSQRTTRGPTIPT